MIYVGDPHSDVARLIEEHRRCAAVRKGEAAQLANIIGA